MDGRPTDYRPEFCEYARELREKGATYPELALFFGVARQTLFAWRLKYKDFHDALKVGTEAADERVVDSLWQRATGYEHDVEKPFIDQKTGAIKIAKHVERLPPDPTSMIFWLKNRQPDKWRDRRESEMTVKGQEGEGNSLAKLASSIAALADKIASGDGES